MYAKQAERYVGDSSLNDDSDLTDNSTEASQLQTNGIENEAVSNDENRKASIQNEDTNDAHVDESPYNYEEVSLNQVSTTNNCQMMKLRFRMKRLNVNQYYNITLK